MGTIIAFTMGFLAFCFMGFMLYSTAITFGGNGKVKGVASRKSKKDFIEYKECRNLVGKTERIFKVEGNKKYIINLSISGNKGEIRVSLKDKNGEAIFNNLSRSEEGLSYLVEKNSKLISNVEFDKFYGEFRLEIKEEE